MKEQTYLRVKHCDFLPGDVLYAVYNDDPNKVQYYLTPYFIISSNQNGVHTCVYKSHIKEYIFISEEYLVLRTT